MVRIMIMMIPILNFPFHITDGLAGRATGSSTHPITETPSTRSLAIIFVVIIQLSFPDADADATLRFHHDT